MQYRCKKKKKNYEMRVISYLEEQMVPGLTKLVFYAQIRRLKALRIKTV